jgi:hypothetical protein
VPEAAGLHLLAGAVEDMDAQRFEPDAAQDAAGSQRAMNRNVRSEIEGSVRLAWPSAHAAAAIDPALMGARLRLGACCSSCTSCPGRSMLEGAQNERWPRRSLPRTPLSERLDRLSGNVEAARRLLDEARTVAPDRQSAWVALAQLEEAAGRPDQARAIVREGLARSGKTVVDEWWSYRNGGLDREGLAWLRARVRR